MRGYYDYNVHSSEPDALCLTAYRQRRDKDGFICTDTSNYKTLRIPLDKGKNAIRFLLGYGWEQYHPFTDYDDWISSPWDLGRPPVVIRRFIATLPPYELEETNGLE